MRIVVAPDSFKGSLTSREAVEAISAGIHRVFPKAEIERLPLSDGGEGIAESLVEALGGDYYSQTVTGPLGDKIKATWALLSDGDTAVVELAAASGLTLVPKAELNPLAATTFGTGELIKDALDHGCKRLVIGLGGSATNDGAVGIAQALGGRFLNDQGQEIGPGGQALEDLVRIDLSSLDSRIKAVEVLVACDVDNPLCGPKGAAYVYGPQKGADELMVARLDKALFGLAAVISKDLGMDVLAIPGGGAAGGAGAGTCAFLGGTLRSGIDIVLEAARFSEKVSSADLVITGEGMMDSQTAYGKLPVGVAQAAKEYQIPVIALAGSLQPGVEKVLEKGIDAYFSIVPGITTLDTAMGQAYTLLADRTEQIMRTIKIGYSLK